MLLFSFEGSVAPDKASQAANCSQTCLSVAERDVATDQLGQFADFHEALLPLFNGAFNLFRLYFLTVLAVRHVPTNKLDEPTLSGKLASILLVNDVLPNEERELEDYLQFALALFGEIGLYQSGEATLDVETARPLLRIHRRRLLLEGSVEQLGSQSAPLTQHIQSANGTLLEQLLGEEAPFTQDGHSSLLLVSCEQLAGQTRQVPAGMHLGSLLLVRVQGKKAHGHTSELHEGPDASLVAFETQVLGGEALPAGRLPHLPIVFSEQEIPGETSQVTEGIQRALIRLH